MAKENREILIYLDILMKHDWSKVYKALVKKDFSEFYEDPDFNKKYNKVIAKYSTKGVNILTILDKDYPKEFLSIQQPPFVIYYTGDFKILKNAIKHQDYVYLHGPNKFDLDRDKLITLNYGNIVLGKNDFTMWTDRHINICRLIPVIANKLVCTCCIKNADVFNAIVFYNLSMNLNKDTYVIPTLIQSTNNELIKDGAFLLDNKEQLL